jgi:pimeloyl-ACP methyl ester carboxylesterase
MSWADCDYEAHLVDSRTCVIAFAAGQGDFSEHIPQYEFGNTLRRQGLSYVLMRDRSERWYQDGVSGLGGLSDTLDYVRKLALQFNVITIGVSSGAYGALLYGLMAGGVKQIIAISPITGRGEDVYPEFDPKWHPRLYHPPNIPPVMDLKPWFMQFCNRADARTKAFVSDGDGTELDRQMAERIGITDITFIPGHSHAGLARHMRDTGLFDELLK